MQTHCIKLFKKKLLSKTDFPYSSMFLSCCIFSPACIWEKVWYPGSVTISKSVKFSEFVALWGVLGDVKSEFLFSEDCLDTWSKRTWLDTVFSQYFWHSQVSCCSTACGIFLNQGLNPCPLHWQADSYPLHSQGNLSFLTNSIYFVLNFPPMVGVDKRQLLFVLKNKKK